ncbi:aminoglycoside adenylyltransferase domain-containing protein [Planomicrobium okeanokoites]|uniref:aminoglycoside adenylyltransferase domain-containing protein n=1 Tax=Planomicrobium okeanokoites TaxID=244 RepID=UPI000A059225|nr:aminoglycoside adenylyltransferase domain-containing protein [Planomicrobium okeanokoites]
MGNETVVLTEEIKEFLDTLIANIDRLIDSPIIGVYLHGSLAMGGFNPARSDIDLLVVTETPISLETKRKLAALFLEQSRNPYPVEISVLNQAQLKDWKFPTPYDFHFSEYWRERFEQDAVQGTTACLDTEGKSDIDLASHFMILHQRGICLDGRPIDQVFPMVPKADYIASILDDYEDCLEKILREPVYSVLNLIRVYWYLKEGEISSKQEAGGWGAVNFPEKFASLAGTALKVYEGFEDKFNREGLLEFRDYIDAHVKILLKEK